jgi:agmatinase
VFGRPHELSGAFHVYPAWLVLPLIGTLDPAFVPGTGTPEPGGLTPREAFPIVRRLCAESNVVGFELVELAPMLDPTYVSAMNANRIIRECMTGIAMRKKGIEAKHYLSPLTVSDNKD